MHTPRKTCQHPNPTPSPKEGHRLQTRLPQDDQTEHQSSRLSVKAAGCWTNHVLTESGRPDAGMHSETPRQRAEVGAMLLQSRHTGERWETPDIGRGGASWEPAVKSLFSACERRNSEVEGPSCRKLQEQLHRTLPLTAPFCRARCTPDQGTRSPCSPPSAG